MHLAHQACASSSPGCIFPVTKLAGWYITDAFCVTPPACLPACLRHLSLHHTPNYEQLCVLLRLLVHLPKLHSLSLHFCCLGKQAASTQGAGNGAGGVGVGGILAGAAAVLGLGVGLGPVGGGPPAVHAAAAGAGEDGDGFGPKDAALRIAAAPGLTTVTLEVRSLGCSLDVSNKVFAMDELSKCV